MTPLTAPPTENETAAAREKLQRLCAALEQVLFGQQEVVEAVVLGLVARGHLLLEGLPGLGKTQLAKALAASLGLDGRRVQFTPDLLPGDITGGPILEETPAGRRLVFHRGPVFANLVLADEINRASPKTQSALLEAMQERRVTVMGETHALPEPFFVIATQNPIELEGTYPLPEAQVDRFLFKIDVPRPGADVLERIVLHRSLGTDPEVPEVMKREELLALSALAARIHVPQPVAAYIARLVHATQPGESAASAGVKYGAGPRAALALAAASRARALLEGRVHIAAEDVRAVAPAVLRHRLVLDYAARIEGRTPGSVIAALLAEVPGAAGALPKTLAEAKR